MKWKDERAMHSYLSMNSMAKMPDMLEPIGRPSLCQKMQSSKLRYMLWSVTLSSSVMLYLERWYVLYLILLILLSMARYGCVQGHNINAYKMECNAYKMETPITKTSMTYYASMDTQNVP